MVTKPLSKNEYIVLKDEDMVTIREIEQSPIVRSTSDPMLNELYLCDYRDE